LKCEICGKEIERSHYSNAILCSSECFEKHYWKRIIAEKDQHIIIDGNSYCDGGDVKNPNSDMFLGCSGCRFWIRFKDGRTITTNNLWVQGRIPDEFRAELPDTAEFYTPEHIRFANSIKLDQHGKGNNTI